MSESNFDRYLGIAARKAAEVLETSARKKQELAGVDPLDAYVATQNGGRLEEPSTSHPAVDAMIQERLAADAWRREQILNNQRISVDVVNDTELAVMRGGVQLVGGIPALTLDVLGTSPGEEGRSRIADAMDDAAVALRKQTHSAAERLSERMSEHSRRADDVVAAEMQSRAAENADLRTERENAGLLDSLAGIEEFGRNVVDGAVASTAHPTAFANAVVGQLPSLGIGAVAGLSARGAAIARTADAAQDAAVNAARAAGHSGNAASSTLARQALLEEARAHLGSQAYRSEAIRNLMIGTGAMEAGGAYQENASEIDNTDYAVLVQQYPDMAEVLLDPRTQAEARAELASRVGMSAAAIQGPLAGLTVRLAAGFELNPTGLAGTSFGRVTDNIVREGAEELIQSGGGELAGNLAQISQGDVQTGALDNVAMTAGHGAAIGAGMATAAQVPGIAVEAGREVVQGIRAGAGMAVDAAKRRGAEWMAKVDGPANAAIAEKVTELKERAGALVQSMAQRAAATVDGEGTPAPVPAAAAPATQDPILATEPAEGSSFAGQSKLEGIASAMHELATNNDIAPERKRQLSLFAAKAWREANAIAQAMPKDAQERADLEEFLFQSEITNLLDDTATELGEEDFLAQIDALPADAVEITPEGKRQTAEVMEMIRQRPDLVQSTEQVDRMLAQDLGEDDQNLLRGIKESIAAKQEYEAASEEIAERTQYPGKNQEIVRTEALTATGRKLPKKPSLMQYNNAIHHALSQGNTEFAQKTFERMYSFAQQRIAKAKATDAGMLQAYADGVDRVAVAGFKVQKQRRRDGDEELTVYPNKPRSHGMVEQIHVEAAAAAKIYNALVQTYPDLIQNIEGAPLRLPNLAKPRFVSIRGHADAQARAAALLAGERVSTQPTTATTPVVQPVAPVEAEPVAEVQEAAPEQTSEEEVIEPAVVEPEPTPESDLDRAMAMTEDEYIQTVNPSGKVLTEEDTDQLDAIDTLELPDDTEVVARRNEDNGSVTEIHRDLEGNLHAVDSNDGTVLGNIGLQDGETVNYVIPGARGQGVGSLLAREWLRSHPLAPSGGFSRGGEAARRRAFRELQAERAKPASRPLTDRFPTLPKRMDGQVGEQATTAVNRILAGFQPAPNSEGLLARFRTLTDALDNAETLLPAAIRKWGSLSQEQLNALNSLSEDVTALHKTLHRMLQERARSHKTLREWLTDPAGKHELWKYANWASVHALEFGRKEDGKVHVRYEPTLAQAALLAAMSWVVDHAGTAPDFDREKAVKTYGQLTPELEQALRTGFLHQAPAESIARMIPRILGMQARNDVPANYSNDTMQALALDALQALQESGVLQRKDVETGVNAVDENGKETKHAITVAILSFPQDSANNYKQLREQLDGGSSLRQILVGVDDVMPAIGKAPTSTPQRIKNSFQDLSREMIAAIKKLQRVPFKRNAPLFDAFNKLGDHLLPMLGHVKDTTGLVPSHKAAVDGFNRALERSVALAKAQDGLMAKYGEENDVDHNDVETFYQYEVQSNARLRMKGFSPQADKTSRALFTPSRATLDLTGNEQHMREWLLGLGQAFRINTTKYNNDLVGDKVRALLRNQDIQALLANLIRLQQMPADDAALGELGKQVATQFGEVVETHGFPDGTDLPRTFNALLDAARYQAADEVGRAEFTTSVTVEIDGKTNGPFNALLQFAMHHIDEKTIQQMRQTGLFFNEAEPAHISKFPGMQDLYETLGERTTQFMAERVGELKGLAREAYLQSQHLMEQAGLIEQVETEEGPPIFKATRKLGKGPLMTLPYGAGDATIVRAMVYGFIDKLNERASAAAQEGQPLDAETRQMLQTLLSMYQDKEGTWHKRRPNTNVNAVMSADRDPLHPADLRTLFDNVEALAGSALLRAVHIEMARPLDTMVPLYALTAVQWAAASAQYQKEKQARHAAMVADGLIHETDQLPRATEQQILRSMRNRLPLYGLSSTGDRNDFQGITTLTQERQTVSQAQRNGEKFTQVQSLYKNGLRMMPSQLTMNAPGVRVAPMSNIAGGDASMILSAVKNNDVSNVLMVFDGVEIQIGQVREWGKKLNDAVLDTMRFSMLDSIMETVDEGYLADAVRELDADDIKVLMSELRLNPQDDVSPKDAVLDALQDTIARLKELQAQATHNRKIMLDERRWDIDQMSTGENSTRNEAPLVDNVLEGVYPQGQVLVTAAQAPEVEYIEEAPTAPAREITLAPVTSALEERLQGLDAIDGIATLSGVQVVAMLDKLPGTKEDKLPRAVYQLLRGRIPQNLQLHFGTREAIEKKLGQAYPKNAGAVFHENQIFLVRPSLETLVHELVHATSYGLMKLAYGDKTQRKQLTTHQLNAVAQLETLAREFVALDPRKAFGKITREIEHALVQAQSVVSGHLSRGETAEAVNEYTAWAMTSRALAYPLLRKQAPSGIKKLAQVVLKHIRELLNLPNNVPVNNFLEQTMGQFHRLVRRQLPDGAQTLLDTMPLFQMLASDSGQSAHTGHVEATLARFDRMLQRIRPQLRNRTEQVREAATRDIVASDPWLRAEAFMRAGFQLTKQEEMAFRHIHAVMGSVLEMDAAVMHQFSPLYLRAMKALTPSDLMEDPESTDQIAHNIAEQQYQALLGNLDFTGGKDAQGRDVSLTNFIAMSQVHGPLRRFLQTQAANTHDLKKYKGMNLDAILTNGTNELLDRMSEMALKVDKAPNALAAMDTLVHRLETEQLRLLQRIRSDAKPQLLDQVQAPVKALMAKAGHAIGQVADRLDGKPGKKNPAKQLGHLALRGLQAMAHDTGADMAGEAAISVINESAMPSFLKKLVLDVIGQTEVNRPLLELLNQGRQEVATLRQRLREEGPGEIRALLTEKLTKPQWAQLHRVIGKTDLQALLGTYTATQLIELLSDPAKLEAALETHRDALAGMAKTQRTKDALLRESKHLAEYMVTGYNQSVNLARNATTLITMYPRQNEFSGTQAAMLKAADTLVTLEALAMSQEADKALLLQLLKSDAKGMQGILTTLRRLNRAELNKSAENGAELNRLKGYLPETRDPRHTLVLAGPIEARDLLRKGYVRLREYNGDARDNEKGLAYYAMRHAGGMATYTQGALQTVEMTVASVDALTGTHLGPQLQTKRGTWLARSQVNPSKHPQGKLNLVPLYGWDSEAEAIGIIGYQRPIDPVMLEQHTYGEQDLAQSMAHWFGRQLEEDMARRFNRNVVDVVVNDWKKGKKNSRENEYRQFNGKDVPKSVQEAWKALPRKTQNELRGAFPDGKVMVREDQLDNLAGYRQASVADVFTGMGDLPPELRRGIQEIAYGLLGPNAYKYLVTAERAWQGMVRTSKDWIIVRSLVVPAANALANQFQMVQMGVPIHGLARKQARKVQETRLFLRNQKRQAQIVFELKASTDPGERRRLKQESDLIDAENQRMSIHPLIRAGEFPTITEGLSESDDYTIVGDLTRWVEQKVGELPKPLSTAARYAVVSKDTALYQGLNRSIQFGDFVAKAVLFDHLTQVNKLPPEKAMAKVSEAFVNYTRLGGRGRDYLEGMGGLWFWNYKLRIQKIVLATMRDNPVRFLLMGAGAEWLGSDSLLSSNALSTSWDYSIGADMLGNTHEMLIWNQVVP